MEGPHGAHRQLKRPRRHITVRLVLIRGSLSALYALQQSFLSNQYRRRDNPRYQQALAPRSSTEGISQWESLTYSTREPTACQRRDRAYSVHPAFRSLRPSPRISNADTKKLDAKPTPSSCSRRSSVVSLARHSTDIPPLRHDVDASPPHAPSPTRAPSPTSTPSPTPALPDSPTPRPAAVAPTESVHKAPNPPTASRASDPPSSSDGGRPGTQTLSPADAVHTVKDAMNSMQRTIESTKDAIAPIGHPIDSIGVVQPTLRQPELASASRLDNSQGRDGASIPADILQEAGHLRHAAVEVGYVNSLCEYARYSTESNSSRDAPREVSSDVMPRDNTSTKAAADEAGPDRQQVAETIVCATFLAGPTVPSASDARPQRRDPRHGDSNNSGAITDQRGR